MRKEIVSLILILILFSSSLAFGVIQSTFFTVNEIEPPKSFVLEEISPREKSFLIRNGFLVITFEYSEKCEDCKDVENYLRDLVLNDLDGQGYLILRKGSRNEVRIESFLGSLSFRNFTEEKLFEGICELAFNPPLECALREIK